MWEFCKHGGWNLAAELDEIQIFYTEDEKAVPIETDPVLEIENISHIVEKNKLNQGILIAVCVILALIAWASMSELPRMEVYSDGGMLTGLALLIVIVGLLIRDYLSISSWLEKARQQVETDGTFLDFSGTKKREIIAIVLITILFLMVISNGGSSSVICAVLRITGLTFIAFLLRSVMQKLKEKGKSADLRKILFIVLDVALIAALFIGLEHLSDKHFSVSEDKVYTAADLPITIANLTIEEELQYTYKIEQKDSILMSMITAYQVPQNVDNDNMVLSYSVAKSNSDILLNIVLKDEIKDVDRLISEAHDEKEKTGIKPKYKRMDEELWNAEEAYQLYVGEKSYEMYVVKWENRVAALSAGWHMTEDERETISKLLQDM